MLILIGIGIFLAGIIAGVFVTLVLVDAAWEAWRIYSVFTKRE